MFKNCIFVFAIDVSILEIVMLHITIGVLKEQNSPPAHNDFVGNWKN